MDIKIIEKARHTAIEMLEDRGFKVSLDQHNIARDNLEIMLDNNNVNLYVSRTQKLPVSLIESEIEPITEEQEGEEQEEEQEGEEQEEEQEEEEEGEQEQEGEEEGPLVEVELGQEGGTKLKGGAHSLEAYVYFHVAGGKFDKKRLVSTVAKIQETYQSNDINIIIVVKDKNITAPVLKEIQRETYRNVEVFYYKDLQSNKSKNRLVPRHKLLTEEEIAEIAENYSLTSTQFYKQSPIIFTTDPMARYYGLQDGDMCRIHRRSKANGISISYRAVVRQVT